MADYDLSPTARLLARVQSFEALLCRTAAEDGSPLSSSDIAWLELDPKQLLPLSVRLKVRRPGTADKTTKFNVGFFLNHDAASPRWRERIHILLRDLKIDAR
jgi:hypothetical protein